MLKKERYSYETSLDKAKILNDQFQSVFTLNQILHYQTKVPVPSNHACLTLIYRWKVFITSCSILTLIRLVDQIKYMEEYLKRQLTLYPPSYLRTLFQSSLDSQVIPDDWRSANITPLFKQGDKQQPSNCRPISLTSIVSKLLEQIINSNIMQHLEINNILSDHQYGFRHSRSCETLLIALLHDL